jgi:hypothetical protein
MTNANYHAIEITLRHQMTHSVQFDVNYTLSKSIDLASDAERVGPASYTSSLNNVIINAWAPKQERAVSSFDLRHQMNANWILQLPFGRGKLIAGNAGGVLNAIIGGWQLSGLFRITSGFPVNSCKRHPIDAAAVCPPPVRISLRLGQCILSKCE